MRRNNEKYKVSAHNFGKGITNQTLLYQHMSNHYRRILNAKKAIDTAPPVAYKTRASAFSPVRSFALSDNNNRRSNGKRLPGRSDSPAPSERTASTTYSNGDYYSGTESNYERKCEDARTNPECDCSLRFGLNPNTPDMEFVNQILYDTENGPADSFNTSWKNVKGRSASDVRSPYEVKKNASAANAHGNNKKLTINRSKLFAHKRKLPQKDKMPSDLLEKHSRFFISYNAYFYPRILKTDAASKVKGLKVYHPPRKKSSPARPHWTEKSESKTSIEELSKMKSKACDAATVPKRIDSCGCKCKKAADNARSETGQTSSRDSAYNGGVSSLPESRSPTPDQRKTTCSCHAKTANPYYERMGSENVIVPNLRLTSNQDSQTDACHEADVAKVDLDDGKSTAKDDRKDERETMMRKIKEEALYTNFIRDITAEVLEKGLYTNKALKKVMKKHVMLNLTRLDKERMLKEVDKLRIQLGIPEDQDLLDVKPETGASATDAVEEGYPLVSDSELVEPESFRRGKSCNKSRGTRFRRRDRDDDDDDAEEDAVGGSNSRHKGREVFPKSISDIVYPLDDNNLELQSDTDNDDDDELISVIQVSKMIKERKRSDREASSDQSRSPTRANSADESEMSSDNAARTEKSNLRFRSDDKSSSTSSLESGACPGRAEDDRELAAAAPAPVPRETAAAADAAAAAVPAQATADLGACDKDAEVNERDMTLIGILGTKNASNGI